MSPYVDSKSRYSSGMPVLDTDKPNLDRACGHGNTAMPSLDLNDSYLNDAIMSHGNRSHLGRTLPQSAQKQLPYGSSLAGQTLDRTCRLIIFL
jgi:hypothetical protein